MNQTADYSSQKTLTLILYVLYIAAIFTAGILAIIALIINYVKQDEMRGTIFDSHFQWQIRTFWWYLAWNILAFAPFILLFFTQHNTNMFAGTALLSTILCVAIIGLSWIWVVYRAIRGLIALNDDQPIRQTGKTI